MLEVVAAVIVIVVLVLWAKVRKIWIRRKKRELEIDGRLLPEHLRTFLKGHAQPKTREFRWMDMIGLIVAIGPWILVGIVGYLATGFLGFVFLFGFITIGSTINYLSLPKLPDDFRRPVTYLRSFNSDTILPESFSSWIHMVTDGKHEGYEGALARS